MPDDLNIYYLFDGKTKVYITGDELPPGIREFHLENKLS